ncbi:S41 family peptidase [Lactiplantibacillus nangangensis]|uniref:S41 family peptidase n=1 Tax=Lactiplantibacillus nangangensis TaxID=2559917 RepID=A0ABW1SI86_9LACO|nr:S41 family peptidase [Lactiplantibacillus nangangensis]
MISYISKKLFTGIAVTILGLTISGCTKPKESKPAFDATPAITMMSKEGLIEDSQAWEQVLKQTDHGKKIKTVKELSKALSAGNSHSWAVSSLGKIEHITQPSTTTVGQLKIINVPAFYTNSAKKRQRYVKTLTKQVQQVRHDHSIILNFVHNTGGDVYPMVAGLSALIPNGTLWSDVDNHGKAFKVRLTKHQVTGGMAHDSEPLASTGKLLNKRIYVITDQTTASAAEFTIIALAHNPRVTIVGRDTAGATSQNKTVVIGQHQAVAVITVGSITTSAPINGKQTFNNDPISPTFLPVYAPMPATDKADYTKQQPLDKDFLAELAAKIKSDAALTS